MRKIDLTSFNIATSEIARSINRRIVLDLIRTKQPVSRADLARLSGLQRSTISIITDQLVEEKWVAEGGFRHLPRGRKPRFLNLNVERVGIIGVNVRPTETTIALANLNADFVAQEVFSTRESFPAFMKELTSRLKFLIDSHSQIFFEGIGISVPGRVDNQNQRLAFAPNLGWKDVDLKTPLEEEFNLTVQIENAANACALAQIWFEPRAEGVKDLVAVTVSEGIGTGIVVNGQLMRGNGFAGEFGHVSIAENGLLCKCGNHDCWELYASNQAAIRLYTQGGNLSHPAKSKEMPAGLQPSFNDILRLAEQGESRAIKSIEQMAHYLGVGLSMLTVGIAPETLVIIGEITRAWKTIYPIIQNVIDERMPSLKNTTKIVASEESAQPRLRGSVALILQKHFGAPVTA